MKILILNYEWPPLGGGGAPMAENLAIKYVEFGHQVDVVTMRYKKQPRYEVRDSIRLHRVPCLRRKMETCETPEMISYVIMGLIPAIKLCRKLKPDVIHCHFAIPTGLLALLVRRICGISYILTCHGSDLPGYNPSRFKLAHNFTKPVVRRACKDAAAVVSPSEYLNGFIQKNVGDFKVEVIPNGIDYSRFEYENKPEKPAILMCGRLLEFKGFVETLEALSGIPGDYEVHVAGDGPMRGQMEEIAEKMPQKVTFHGWLDNSGPVLKDLYRGSTIFSMPSETENASISLLEAMASGMAVITSNVTGCKETVGDAGLLVPPRNVEALTAALKELLNTPGRAAELGQAARHRVEEKFDHIKLARQYETLLRKTAGLNKLN